MHNSACIVGWSGCQRFYLTGYLPAVKRNGLQLVFFYSSAGIRRRCTGMSIGAKVTEEMKLPVQLVKLNYSYEFFRSPVSVHPCKERVMVSLLLKGAFQTRAGFRSPNHFVY